MPKRRSASRGGRKRKNRKSETAHAATAAATTIGPDVPALTFQVIIQGTPHKKVQVLTNDTTVYDLMDCCCRLTDATDNEGVDEHMWMLDVGANPNNGDEPDISNWSQSSNISQHVGPFRHLAEEHQISESKEDSTPLQDLPLAPGLFIRVMYDMGSSSFFQLVLLSSELISAVTAESLPRAIVTAADDDDDDDDSEPRPFLTDAEVQASVEYRRVVAEVGETAFKIGRRYGEGQVVAAQARIWSQLEKDALQHLVMAGTHKFTKAWNELLCHTMLFRSKSTLSAKWYKFQRDKALLDEMHGTTNWLYGIGDQPPAETLQRAKELLKQVRQMCLYKKPRRAVDDLRELYEKRGFFISRTQAFQMWQIAGGSEREFEQMNFDFILSEDENYDEDDMLSEDEEDFEDY